MDTKVCGKCGIPQQLTAFRRNNRASDGKQSWCITCHEEYDKSHYQRNRARCIRVRRERRQRLAQQMQEYKATLKCSRCPETHPACLQFHHRDAGDKISHVAEMVKGGWSFENIMREVAKCDVMCANCHAKLHWDEKQ